LTAVPVHFHRYKVAKARVTCCLEWGIKYTEQA